MKISIIIPIFNSEKTLAKCIDSCLMQTYSSIEIILINDGSKDSSRTIIEKYANNHNSIIAMHQDNKGVSSARNLGISKCTGDYILFVDSDDWLEYNYVEKLIKAQSVEDYDLTICGINYYQKGKFVRSSIPDSRTLFSQEEIYENLSYRGNLKYYSSPFVKLFRTAIIKDNGILFDESLKEGEDFSFVLEYLKYVHKCVHISYALYNYTLPYGNKKNKHYELDNVQYQYNNLIVLFNNYRTSFDATNNYLNNKNIVDSLILRQLKVFLNHTISGQAKREIIVKQLQLFERTEYYNAILHLKNNILRDKLEKVILLLSKKKMWNALYFVFWLKNKIFNR